jgi:hypothetical protein
MTLVDSSGEVDSAAGASGARIRMGARLARFKNSQCRAGSDYRDFVAQWKY